jgi:phage tail protein X
MKVSLGSAVVLCLLLLGACSSNKPKEDEGTDVIPASVDAGTDIIPQPAADAPIALAPENGQTSADNSLDGLPPAEAPAESSSATTPAEPAASVPPESGSPSGGSGEESYTVRTGDTLMKIAYEVYGDIFRWKDIYEANKGVIHDPNSVPSGVSLKIEKPETPVVLEKNGERYLIKQGDTLGKISNVLYGTRSRWKELWENNKQLIRNPNKIFAGFYLYYSPGSGDSDEAKQSGANTSQSATASGSAAAPTPASESTPPAATKVENSSK